MTSQNINPKRGEIWRVDLNPTKGNEIRKMRPVLVMSSDGIRKLPLRLVAPFTGWQSKFAGVCWMVKVEPDQANGLSKASTVDTLQLRGIDTKRFIVKLGYVSAQVLEEVSAAIAIVVEYQ